MEKLPSFGIQGRGMECIKFLNLFLAGLGAEVQAEKGAGQGKGDGVQAGWVHVSIF